MNQPFDSKPETLAHIGRVQEILRQVSQNLLDRSKDHDQSKLLPPEKEMFDEATGRLKGSTYGSDEYKGFLRELKPALDHHYAHNSHHPEHYGNGVDGMSLLDLIEMFCDWKAATERHADGNIERSIKINTDRFKLSPQTASILENTRKEMGW